jgi:hypothetical protein
LPGQVRDNAGAELVMDYIAAIERYYRAYRERDRQALQALL